MASRPRKRTSTATGRVGLKTASSASPSGSSRPPEAESLVLPALEALIADEGQISVGSIYPIACAAVANDPHNMLAALVRRPGESVAHLLGRLDAAVRLALEQGRFTDEINTPPRS